MRLSLLLILSFISCSNAENQTSNSVTGDSSVSTKDYKWNTKERRSVKGYDVVAYFSLPKNADAVKGKEEFSYSFGGLTWLFSTKENLEAFKKNPEMYIPQYGGYCAYAVSKNYTADIDPHAWTVVGDKLYVNYSKGIRSSWLKNFESRITKGDKNWPGLKAKL